MKLSGYTIIDASVAKALGNPPAIGLHHSYELVQRLKSGPIGICMTPSLNEEWVRHSSRFMIRWLASMESRRRVGHFKDRKVADFRRVLKRVEDPHIRAAIEKDAHLTEAALLLNIAVISLDNKQRVYLCALAERYKKLGGLQWINPTEVGEDCLVWLSGCCSDQGFERLTQ